MLKKYKPYIIAFFAMSLCSLAAASFIDLDLDIRLNNPNSAFAIWFEATGEMPCRLLTTVAGVLLFYLCDKLWQKALGLLINLGGSVYLGYHIAHYLFRERYNLAFGIVFGIGFAAVALWVGKYISVPEQLKKTLIILSVAGVAVMFVQLGIIEIVKIFWGRIRFRDLIKMQSYEAFTQWYHPNGANGHRSFPSGHTAGAAMSYLMMFFPYISKKWAYKRYLCFSLPLIYTSIVAYTRLVMGAHYLSDVTVGGMIGFITVIAAMYVLDKKFFNTGKINNTCNS